MEPSQMSVDDFYDEDGHEGVKYKIEKDGTASVSPNQMSIDDVAQDEEIENQDDSDESDDEENDDPFAQVTLSNDDSLE